MSASQSKPTNADIIRNMLALNEKLVEDGKEEILTPKFKETMQTLLTNCEGQEDDYINLQLNKLLKPTVMKK